MADEWEPMVGDVVWVRLKIDNAHPDVEGDLVVSDDYGRRCFVKPEDIRPDAPAPMEMDDVAVLRRAADVLAEHGNPGTALCARHLSDKIEAARRVPTPLEALRWLVEFAEKKGLDAPRLADARRAIAAAEKGGV